jgi:hypothetical protein
MRLFRRKCVGRRQCTVGQGDNGFSGHDPCFGVYKSLFVQARCSKGEGQVVGVLPTNRPTTVSIPAQQAFVVPVTVKAPGGGTRVQYIWGGDRWQSAPDGFKSHDYQVWVPMSINASGDIAPLVYSTSWSLELPDTR